MELILEELVKTKFVESYTKKILINNEIEIDEVIQFIWCEVLEYLNKNEEKMIKIYLKKGIYGITQIVSGLIHRQLQSKNSRFHYQYIKKQTNNIIKKRSNDKTDSYNEVEGWKTDNINNNKTKYQDTFDTLKYEYNLNPNDSEIITAFNTSLDEIEQSILINFIKNNNKYSTTSRELKVSVPFLKGKIEEIKKKIIIKYNELQ